MGFLVTRDQPTKIAAMEATWDTHEAPAPLTLFAIPNEAEQKNAMEISIPWVFGLMGTRSLSTEIPGIKQLEAQAEERIKNGQKAVATLEALRKDPKNEALRAEFQALQPDLGFGLLLKRYTEDVRRPRLRIKQAAQDTTPQVAPFWSFRLMISCGSAWRSSSCSALSSP
ncbi:MAG: cytochrome ubiquinol oxidase subunit I [Sutterella wadsworthensis]